MCGLRRERSLWRIAKKAPIIGAKFVQKPTYNGQKLGHFEVNLPFFTPRPSGGKISKEVDTYHRCWDAQKSTHHRCKLFHKPTHKGRTSVDTRSMGVQPPGESIVGVSSVIPLYIS